MTIEYGWVIENGASDPSAPTYWCGVDGNFGVTFTTDAFQAIRFARKADAERAARAVLPGMEVRIAQHAWDQETR